MKNIKKILLVSAIFCALDFSVANAADPGASVAQPQLFGIVDTTRVLQTSEAARSLSSQLETKRKEFAAQIAKEQDSVRAVGKKFEKDRASMTREQWNERRKDLDKKLYGLQKMMQGKEAILDKGLGGAMAQLRQEVKKIVAQIAKERHLSAVLTQDAVMLSVPQMDLTPEVITRLNQSFKMVNVDWSAASSDKDKAKSADKK